MAESQGQGDFWAGLVVGAVVGSVVGTVVGLSLAPRLQRAAKKNKSRPALDAGGDEESQDQAEKLSEVRRNLETKINELNTAIQDTRSQLLTATGSLGNTVGHREHPQN